jgi:hypothetical protein
MKEQNRPAHNIPAQSDVKPNPVQTALPLQSFNHSVIQSVSHSVIQLFSH